jgi:hypothetical protein
MNFMGVSFLRIEIEKTPESIIMSCVWFSLLMNTDTHGGEDVTWFAVLMMRPFFSSPLLELTIYMPYVTLNSVSLANLNASWVDDSDLIYYLCNMR